MSQAVSAASAPASEEKKDHVAQIYEAFEKLVEPGEGVVGDVSRSSDVLVVSLMDLQVSENWYLVLIDAVKGESKVKQLVAEFIPRFFDQVPKLQEQALNAQLDLCEDENSNVRFFSGLWFPC